MNRVDQTATNAPDASAPRQRRRGWLGFAVKTLLVGLLAAIAVLPSWLVTPERVSKLVASEVPELLADLRIGRIGFGWLGPIVLEDIALVPRNGDQPPVSVRRVEVSNGLAGILLSFGDLGRIRIESPRGEIVFDKEHRTNLDAILPPPPAEAAPAPAEKAPAPRTSPLRMAVEVDDAVVRITGPWTTDPWVSDPIDLRARLTAATGGGSEWIVEPVQLLANAQLEQTVAQEVLAYIVPVFADAARTSGRFSLRLDKARLPVGHPGDGEVAGVLAMHEVVLGPGPLVAEMFQKLPLKLPPPPTVRIADESHVQFELANRRVWHSGLEFGVPLVKPGQRLDVHSEGFVGLDDRSLDLRIKLPIPADLPQDRPLVAALAGKQISLGVEGELGQPRVKFDGSIKAAAGQVLADFIDRLGKDPPPPTPALPPQPTAEPGRQPPPAFPQPIPPTAETKPVAPPDTTDAIIDIVGGVLDEVAKRRAERRAAEAGNPQLAPPPRRGRLIERLRELAPPPSPPAEPPPPAPPATPPRGPEQS